MSDVELNQLQVTIPSTLPLIEYSENIHKHKMNNDII